MLVARRIAAPERRHHKMHDGCHEIEGALVVDDRSGTGERKQQAGQHVPAGRVADRDERLRTLDHDA
jgi:hypothetical protein